MRLWNAQNLRTRSKTAAFAFWYTRRSKGAVPTTAVPVSTAISLKMESELARSVLRV